MLVLGLITCIVLRALSAQAKVVHSFNECKEFFYKGIEPSGMDQNAKKICQKLENRGFSYATLYSVRHKIPLYSAYTLDPYCSSDTGRTDDWHLEPQVTMSWGGGGEIISLTLENCTFNTWDECSHTPDEKRSAAFRTTHRYCSLKQLI